MTLLFVCTANVSRSPFAARRTEALGAAQHVIVSSAGIPGVVGRAMDTVMAAELVSRGGDPRGHVSRCLTDELVEAADLMLTFEFAQHMRILQSWPGAAGKTFGLQQFADALDRMGPRWAGDVSVKDVAARCAPDSMTLDVRDPYGRGRRVARRCADEIDEALLRIVPALERMHPQT